MTDDVEVLVHISASTTRQNDELFRAVASAYTEFKPCKTHRNQEVPENEKARQAIELRLHASSATPGKPSYSNAVEAMVPTASKESYGSFPSYISSDGRHTGDYSVPGDDTERPVSRLAQLDRSYLSWRKHASPRLSFKQGLEKTQLSSDGLEDADTGFIEDSQSALQALQSQLRDTWSMTSEDSSVDEFPEDTDVGGNDMPSCVVGPTGAQSPRIAEAVCLSTFSKDRHQNEADVSSSRDIADPSESTHQVAEAYPNANTSQLDFSKIPIDALPPPPAISVVSPLVLPSQITRHLAAIKAKNPKRFNPLKIQRKLESDERGYWRVDCTQWPPLTQQEFWSLLHEHVCSGRIGWGITLHRESSSPHTLGIVRLYCWGEVAEHMWLLMWLCSQGKLSTLGSQWIDADGVAVVDMN